MSLCQDCVKGVTHEGTPKGKWESIGGVNSYVATPAGEYPKNKAILFLPDVFGPQLPNAQLLADDFAANGIKTIIPDYLNGDPIPADALGPGSTFNIGTWFPNHGQDKTRPSLDKVLEALKEEGVTEFAATGYCFGGRYVFDLAFDNVIKVGVVSHPSLLKVPEDLEKYAASSKAALLINSCTIDSQFPLESSAKADEIFGDGKFAPGYKREYFEGCSHGFAVRGDLSNPQAKAGKEGSFKASVEWIKKYI
jgi:dienelactone hydrolase